MEAFVIDYGKKAIERLINIAIHESSYIFCFNSIVVEFNGARDKLETERITMEQQFKVATQKDKDISYSAQKWKDNVDDLILEDTKTKTKFIKRHERGKELTAKIKEIQGLMDKVKEFQNVEITRPSPGAERYSSQYYISLKSRELKNKELLVALEDDSIFLTGLCGMGGTGKTTLAKEVGKQLKSMKQFDHVIDTTVSNTPDINKIQDDIAGSLGLKWKDCTISDRPKMLWRRLTNGEKILVILDDVWKCIDFDDIGIPNKDNNKGCRVLVTTRNGHLCNTMECRSIIQLELLTEEDAWIMFKMYADINNNSSSKSFLDKGRKIAIECKRLPVAIAITARSLKGQKRKEEWDAALTFLQKPVPMANRSDDNDNELLDIYKCLKFSYDNLKDERAKKLFLLCSIFEEDAEISIEILTRITIGVGIFGEYYSNYKDVRGQAMRAKNKLLDSCLLLETKKGDMKMHDMVREVAQWIAKKEIRRINFLNKDQKSLVEREKNIKYLFCEGKLKDLFSSKFDGSKLELLFVNMELFDVPISFLESIIGIRVLILIHNGVRKKLSLLQSIQSLTNIRTLMVQNVNLGNISALGNLSSLETLDLDECDIDNLPCEIENLENLRLLNLKSCKIECNNPFEVIQNCSSLEVLYFYNSFNRFCKEITIPTTLQRFHVIDGHETVPYSLSKCVAFQHDIYTEATYKYVFETAKSIHLDCIEKGWRNLMPEIVKIDKGMDELIKLHLEDISHLKCLVNTKHINSQLPPNVFSKLVALHLEDMENMETLVDGPISFDSFSNLEKISILFGKTFQSLFKCSLNLCNLKTLYLLHCSKLVSVFDLSTSKSLLNLEALDIRYCEKLENLFTNDTIEEILDVDDKSSYSMFPKLKVLNILKCDKLQFILPRLSSEVPLLLESITIERCEKLKYIFGQHQQVELASLTELKLSDLPNFIDIFPESHHSTMPSSISKVTSKPQTQSEPKKPSKFSWSHMCCYGYKFRDTTTTSTNIPLVSEDQQHECSTSMVSNLNYLAECFSKVISTHDMCNIKEIELCNLPNTMSVFILSVAQIMSLESLTISACNELKHILVEIDSGRDNIVFQKLKKFVVSYCEKLEYICGHNNAASHDHDHQEEINEAIIHLHFPALEHLKLHRLPSLIGMCTKNYCTTLPSLMNLELNDCTKFDIKSIGDSSVPNNLLSIAQESTTFKKLSGNMERFITLESLVVKNDSKLESMFCVNEVNEQKMSLTLKDIELHVMSIMMCPFVGPRDTFALQNLTTIQIMRCDKLEIVFPTSVIRYLPHMESISIEDCNELKYIIEDDDHLESKIEISRTCFPKLTEVLVINCNKLKSVFPISACKEFPELKALAIREANDLEEIFKSDDKVEIPNLKWVVLVNLPSLFHAQRIHFEAVENRSIQNCPKLSLTSAVPPNFDDTHIFEGIGFRFYSEWNSSKKDFMDQRLKEQKQSLGEIDIVIKPSHENNNLEGSTSEQKTAAATMSTISETKNEPIVHLVSPKLKGIKTGFEEEATSTHLELGSSSSTPFITFESKTSSHDLMDQRLTLQQQSLGEIDTVIKPSHENINITMKQILEAEHKFVDNVPNLESKELMNEQSMDQQHPLGEIVTTIKHSQGNNLEGSTSEQKTEAAIMSTISETKNEPKPNLVSPKLKGIEKGFEEGTTSTYFKLGSSSSHEDGDGQISMNSLPIVIVKNNDEVRERSIVEQLSPTGDKIIDSKTSPSSISSQFHSLPFEVDSSETIEDLSSFLLVTRELEQLVSKKYLDHQNLSVLIDFLVEHPTVLLRDTSLSNRYKGYAYNYLAELLKFLQMHSVSDVLGSSHSEFVEILQDAHRFPFDKNWLNDVEKRALFPGLQVSKAALQKLLDSKHILTQHVEDLKNQLASSEAILECIIHQEEKILETRLL